jgi:UDP-N-acetylenolpyruvoylglucosamine reductase
VGCQSGKRSEVASKILADAGYSNVTNVEGGFMGALRDLAYELVAGSIPGCWGGAVCMNRGIIPGSFQACLFCLNPSSFACKFAAWTGASLPVEA